MRHEPARRCARRCNVLALVLSGVATAIGLFFLGAILWTLVKNGVAGMSVDLFTKMTPPPGSAGGLLNAIYGSVVMTRASASSSAARSACSPEPISPSTAAPRASAA